MALTSFVAPLFGQVSAVSKKEYLDYAESTADFLIKDLEKYKRIWVERFIERSSKDLVRYRPPSNPVYLATLCAKLYKLTGKKKYRKTAKSLLLEIGGYEHLLSTEIRDSLSQHYNGQLPPLASIFTFSKYTHAFDILKESGNLEELEIDSIGQNIAKSADWFVQFQEWGPMNRAMLRAEGMLYAAKMLPDHPHQPQWKMVGEAILQDNIGKWEIEDASGYTNIWLHSMLRYLSYVDQDNSLLQTPILKYYFNYLLALMCPAGKIPDFGDSQWNGSLRLIPIFEKGAGIYRNETLRWAAAEIFRNHLNRDSKDPFTAIVIADACGWADFEIPASRPVTNSQEVLEDMVGKKIVFRDGWDKSSTYLLLNYRDEGDGGWLYREYLRTTIPVEEEKMHHGHSDENSIVLLMKNNTVLLHDAGYRDYMPSGPFGAYRADYFHNRVVVRKGKIAVGQKEGEYRYSTREAVPGQSTLDFLRNSGAYRNVRTHKIDFLSLKHFDMSRTRLIDDKSGYEWDRIINYVKDLNYFVVFDVIRFTEEDYLTMANLWHTRKILAQGDNWFDTTYDSIGRSDVSGKERLLIYFPYNDRLETRVEEQARYQPNRNEKVIHQRIGRHGYVGDLQVFVTVLMPHDSTVAPEEMVKQIKMVDIDQFPRAIGVTIQTSNDKSYMIAAKLDLHSDIIRDWRRPMYNYESGKINYGDYETDAYNLFVVENSDSLHFAITGAAKISYQGRILHEQLPIKLIGLNFDGSPGLTGTRKMRYWEDKVAK